MTALVELKNVSKIIKGKKIIDSLSFTIQGGEVFGFLGPNGAGKTTTIRMIVGLMKLTEGDIVICGHSIQKDFEKAVSHIGAIVENPEMYKFLTGYQNLQQYARMQKGITKERIDEVIELVGLSDRIHDKVKTYSLGMRQRLGIAQSLLHKPKILILDEPTNGLDPAGIKEIRQYIRDLAEKEGMAVIVSSHLLSEMEMMCDRIGIIQKGRLINVQSVHDWVDDGREIYSIEVNHVETAAKLLSASFQGAQIKISESCLSIEANKEQIPEVISLLVSKNIKVYEAKQLSKTLEERFLEITEKQGAVS
ncbi:ABC transporter ATP-binding protein [Pseudobacillus sp. FSL P4-0506]|uniref:ABC transporter ATP-binding protein n=1 Tax=Pseudobacillus sp. FSL P4-0506 TaxID=2921576 RepID=UPI0030FA8BC1